MCWRLNWPDDLAVGCNRSCPARMGGVQVARDCLACLLAKELGKLGYSKVVVAGYTGEVVDSETSDGRARIKIEEGSVYRTLSESERKFDSKGNAIT
jgi:hypothetical protein